MTVLRCALLFIIAQAPFAVAAEDVPALPAYVDDRSDPQALVRSLYNAVNRREFARAWSYFSSPPSKSFEAFADGYADTIFVEIAVGRSIAEGAAGSAFHLVPVAIRATGEDGEEKAFAGCYTLRQVNPQIQEPPYRPLSIEKGALKPADASGFLANQVPETCDGRSAEPPTRAELEERATTLFRAEHRGDCNLADDQKPSSSGRQPEIFELKFRHAYESPQDPERTAVLFRFSCGQYAYNVSEAYYLAGEDGDVASVAFAEPELDIDYTDDTSEKVESMTIVGYRATALLVNSEFDATGQKITSYSKWRGMGDAYSSGAWSFRNGSFVLTGYEVDASYDGEQDGAEIVDFAKP